MEGKFLLCIISVIGIAVSWLAIRECCAAQAPAARSEGYKPHEPVTVTAAQTASIMLTFDSPVTGMLEYVLFYLYERTEETPKRTWTPGDIYQALSRTK